MRDGGPGPTGRSPAGPRVARALARLLLPARDREFILGDLEEMYALRATRDGAGAAGRRYLSDVLRSAAARVAPRLARGGGPWKGQERGGRWLSGLLADVRAAVRTLRREKGFTALVVLTLALGVGSTAVVFGMVDEIVLRPLPGVHDGGRAAYLRFHHPGDAAGMMGQGISTPTFDALRKDATQLAGMASYELFDGKAAAGDGRPIHITGETVYGDFFQVLGVRPAAGRLLTAAETDLDSDPLRVVLSRRLADELFGSPAAAVGKVLHVDDKPMTIVGVAGGGFRGTSRSMTADLWVPFGALTPLMGFPPSALRDRNDVDHLYMLVGLRAGVSLQAAAAQLRAVSHRLVRLDAKNESGPYLGKLEPRLYPTIGLEPIARAMTDRSLRLLAGVVALVLLIACANVANLLLFRNVARRGAVATRRALGASPTRITRQHLVQSLLLGILGAGVGLGVGWTISFLFRGQALAAMPAFRQLGLDHRVAAFAALAAIATALLFGTIPAALAGRFNLASTLRRSEGRHTGRLATLRSALSTGQLALTLTLMVGAGLLLRTVHDLYTATLGLDVDHVTAFPLSYERGLSRSAVDALYRNLLSTVREIPGVRSAALDLDGLPGFTMGRMTLPDAPASHALMAGIEPVTPGWFDLFHVPVTRGRTFRTNDWRRGAPERVVLTESLARVLFGHADAVGRTVLVHLGRKATPLEVVGTVGDMRSVFDPDRVKQDAFVTYSTWSAASRYPMPRVTLLVRTESSAPRAIGRVRKAVAGVLPDEPTPNAESLSATVGKVHADDVLLSHLLLLLAALAAALSAVGLYGIIAFIVAGRRREFGIRIALGAEASRIAGLVFRSGVVIIGAGTALGLGGAYVLSRVLRSDLFGVGPLDPASYYGAVATLALVAAAACWVPARRAMRVDPVDVLREE